MVCMLGEMHGFSTTKMCSIAAEIRLLMYLFAWITLSSSPQTKYIITTIIITVIINIIITVIIFMFSVLLLVSYDQDVVYLSAACNTI